MNGMTRVLHRYYSMLIRSVNLPGFDFTSRTTWCFGLSI
jgi:hypothetical protein